VDDLAVGVLMKFRISEDVQVIAAGAMLVLFVASIGGVLVHACHTIDDARTMGAKWGECYRNRTCDAGLVCVEKRCVPMPDGGLL
jgi:hypothetical protein